MSRRYKTFPRLVFVFYILKILKIQIAFSSTFPEIDLPKEYPSSFIDEVQKSSKIVRRSLNDDFKDKLETPMSFIDEHLTTTNELRAKHGVPALEVDYKLCFEAEEYAKVLAQKSRDANKITVTHSFKYLTGENILGGQNIAKATGKFTAEHWYNESQFHVWTENVFNPKTGHFTQLIWKETKNLGVAQANLPSTGAAVKNITIVVARYIPVGNWAYKSSFKENVLPVVG